MCQGNSTFWLEFSAWLFLKLVFLIGMQLKNMVACNYFTCGVAEFSLLFHAVGAGAATGRRARRRNRRGLGCRSCSMRCGHRLRGSRVCPHICFQQLTIVKYFPLSSTFWQDKIYQNLLPRHICSRHSGQKCHSSCHTVTQSQSQSKLRVIHRKSVQCY